MKRQNEPKKVRARVIWDEANLGEIEANKPTRQKIDEPKTPYHAPEYDDGMLPSVAHNETSLDDAAHAEAVRNALSRLVASTSEWSREGGDCSSGDEAEDMEYDGEVHIANGSGMSFEELRRLHYDEFRKRQELGQKISIDHEADKVNEKERS
uniref:Protein phosphatase inhibitor 2 n=1 Tax=Picea sitchensis TaxID=3332 RepID=A9NZ68_PICSI|nr:unknown [Picea sitchensis]